MSNSNPQEVYVVIFHREGYMNDGISWDYNIQLRQVFASLEAAREYCENPIRYTSEFEEHFYKKFTPSWDDGGRVYILLDDGDNDIYFSIETRVLVTDEHAPKYFTDFTDEPVPKYICESPSGEFFTEQDIKKHLAEMGFEVF